MKYLIRTLFTGLLWLLTIPVIAAPIVTAPTSTTNANTPNNADSQLTHISLLFVQTAQSAKLYPIAGKANYYNLTLYNVNPYITYFTNRPNRVTGVVPLSNFLKAWNVGTNSFAEDNPNAVLTAATINGNINNNLVPVVIQLSSPQYSPAQSTLSFIITPIGSTQFVLPQLDYTYLTLVIGVAGED